MTLLIAPSYDELTEIMSSWLRDTGSEAGEANALFGEDASRASLITRLRSSSGEVVIVFYGHGESLGMLTAPHLGTEPVDKNHCFLCKAGDFSEIKSIKILAYCCSCSSDFGRVIKSASPSNSFIGYKGELPIETSSQERQQAFSRPLRYAVESIISKNNISSSAIKQLVMNGYREEYRKWSSGEHSGDDLAMWMCICLEEHVDLLDFYMEEE